MYRPDPLRHRIEPGYPIYHSVSVRKLVILTIATVGIYEIAWFYRNWWLVAVRKQRRYIPILRSLLFPFFVYQLFKDIRGSAERHAIPTAFSPAIAAGTYIVVSLVSQIDDVLIVVGFLTIIPMAIAQHLANRINALVAPEANRNDRFTVLQGALATAGCCLSALVTIAIIAGPQ